MAYYHTKPFYPVHIVAVPKKHISSLITLEENDHDLLLELMGIIQKIASMMTEEKSGVITNSGAYQDSKHLHWHIVFGKPLK
ncbi:hypothetical protein C7M16_00398 [Bacillus subtilis]|nr:hypothetical protein C7M16_00398 [Bacillus subtilis]